MTAISADQLNRGLRFLREIEALKDTLRSGFTAQGRAESTAEHSWRLCMMAVVFAEHLPTNVDVLRLIKMCLVHDLGETYAGDVPAIFQSDDDGRKDIERRDMQKLCAILGGEAGAEILVLWEEYEAGVSAEARFAKGFDKIETILQHTQGRNPAEFDYEFNLAYGVERTDIDPLLKAVRRSVDEAAARCRDGKAAWND